MRTKNETDHQSPWPACADCHANEPENAAASAASQEASAGEAERTAEEVFGIIEPSAELGPRAEAVRAQVAAALQRALERVRQAKNTEQ